MREKLLFQALLQIFFAKWFHHYSDVERPMDYQLHCRKTFMTEDQNLLVPLHLNWP